LIYLYIKY